MFGPEHPDTFTVLNNLAKLLEAKGDYDAMWILQRQQLDVLERTVGIENEETLRVMQNLAVSLRNAGRLVEAEPLHREVMERNIRVYGEASLEAASTYSAMGALLKLKSELPDAETFLRKSLAIREEKLGPEDDATKLVRSRLDELLLSQGILQPVIHFHD